MNHVRVLMANACAKGRLKPSLFWKGLQPVQNKRSYAPALSMAIRLNSA